MAKIDINFDLIEEYKNKYTKEEFECIISILPRSQLLKPILDCPKAFRGYTDGFRPQNLPDTLLQYIYYNKIYKRADVLLATYLQELIDKSLEEIEKRVSQSIDSPEAINEKLQNNDTEILKQLVDVLCETEYRENISLYFKIVEYELSDEQSDYLEYYIKFKKDLYKIEKDIKETLTSIYEAKLDETAKKCRDKIDEKQVEIRQLKEQIEENKITMADLEGKLDRLYKEYKLEVESLESEIDKLENLIGNLKRENEGKSKKISELSELLEMEYNKFYKIVEKRWFKSNEKLLKQSEDIKLGIEDLKMRRNQILEDIEFLKLQKIDLEEEFILVKDRVGEFIESFQYLLDNVGLKTDDMGSQTNLYTIPSMAFEDRITIIDEREYFIEDLAANLGISGIRSDYSFDLAQYIYAIFANRMNLLIVGYNTRKIADAISSVICGRSAEIITLPLGYNNCNELISVVNGLTGKVILIENAVDNISETTYIPLIKQNKDKFLIFSMESSENIGILSNCIFNYMLPLDIDTIIGYELDKPFCYSAVAESIFNTDSELQSKRYNFKELEKLNKVVELSRTSKLRIAEVMSIIDSLDSDNAIYDVLLFSISMLCKSDDNKYELKNFIEEQAFRPESFRKLQLILGDNLADV